MVEDFLCPNSNIINIMDNEKFEYIDDRLNEIFVEKYKVIKKSVDEINKKLAELNIDFAYGYDEFCLEYKEEMMSIINENPDIELNDLTMFMLSHSILLKMLANKKNFITSIETNH